MNRNTLSPVAQKFILHWGEMGTRWGINRTVAQIHALLFLSPRPLPAEEIAATLGIARSNVSNSLHELQNWGIVRVVHVLGDRRDHFESMKDVFEMFRVITHERKKSAKSIRPCRLLQGCIRDADKAKSADRYTRERLTDLLQFFELAETAYLQLGKLPTAALLKLAKMGTRPCGCWEWQNDDKNFWLMNSEITEMTETKEERWLKPRSRLPCKSAHPDTSSAREMKPFSYHRS